MKKKIKFFEKLLTNNFLDSNFLRNKIQRKKIHSELLGYLCFANYML